MIEQEKQTKIKSNLQKNSKKFIANSQKSRHFYQICIKEIKKFSIHLHQYIFLYLQDKSYVQKQDNQIPNYELQEQFLKIIRTAEQDQKTTVQVLYGIAGIGKTTTLKKIIRQIRKKEEYKDKVFYISLGQKDVQTQKSKQTVKQTLNRSNFNKESQIQKRIQELQIIQYQVLFEKYGKDDKDKIIEIIDKNTNKKKYIAPIIIIDDINQL